MQCVLNIGLEVFASKEPIEYKYVIHSPSLSKARKNDYSPFEFLHGVHGIANRNLILSDVFEGNGNDCILCSPQSD